MKINLLTILIFLTLTLNMFSEEIVTLKNGTKVVIYDDHTWAEYNHNILTTTEIVSKNKQYLRLGINASEKEIIIACEMHEQGWIYTMPRPKSSKAAWGITDKRTTWYNGWWFNAKTNQYSDSTPYKSNSGLYLGDNQNSSNSWRKGGTPHKPDIYMFLLSKSGGPIF